MMSGHVQGQAVQRYMVTVTNMTRGQNFTPILVEILSNVVDRWVS